ncbi:MULTISPECIES: NAD-dependent epimerase/dehydratase family protein [Methylobacterium]|uniref:ADP-L-glycero-D-manno-heptose-6-epimerase n=2 Tax=Pseudomonadota TaxID=1224 RepID=A0ABQ4SWQ5_9HYPH|nr:MULTISPECIES: NAD-dependent epimerase/dehydratase family protein [Methylobacterium]PIU07924.1 MAG: NAD-dependent dehydratase [Methylobacterium sp. CG09_land_8_20_14_0_10_71_15]PIU13734.1 MAG: NAD-dependent dehydratase [Methylobacterium sp. CG08_land_8_20_14_0_20_71_15]GBU17068.1 epimerase [Methylobacterium sp.]GJE06661.1 ADP-L-glycero-D-manno-heptose-6-epimerase [Methylobacterium jeotgali]
MSRLVALTGTTGFIGRHLLKSLTSRGDRVRVLLRRPTEMPDGAASAVVGDLSRPMNMAAALAGVDAVVHSAGLAHAMSGAPEDDYRSANTEATRRLAEAAERAGVRRFVFLSSIRAQSGPSAPAPLTEADTPLPTDAYGRSKLAAEQALAETGLDWAALRPVLVYGPGLKGNMAELMRLARMPYPLPLGGLRARRSLVSVESLASAVATVLDAEGPLRKPMIVAEPDALSLPEMIAALRSGLGRPPGLLPVPAGLIGLACRMTGRAEVYSRLSGNLVATAGALSALGWTPAHPTRDGLAQLARGAR